MNRWIQASLSALLGLAALASHAQTCTQTVNPGADLSSTVINALPDSVICLNPGTYTPNPDVNVFPDPARFAIGNRVTLKGLGSTPADVRLQGGASGDHAVIFVNYVAGKSASGSALKNLTIQGSQGGIQVQNFIPGLLGRLTDIVFKDVVITTVANGSGFGVKLQSADRIVLDNVTVTSGSTALNFLDTTDSLVMNSTVPSTGVANAAGLAVLGGSANRFINNSFGLPRTSAGAGYSFNGGGVVFYNTSDNRFENNLVQGMRDDAVDFTIVDNVLPVTKSLNNYVGKNTVLHTAFALNNSVLGSSGIWSNCSSDGTWIYGNETRGAAECGICIWGSKSNMALANINNGNGITGIFVSGGQEALDFCTAGGNAHRVQPTNTFLHSNANFFNKNDQQNIRNAIGTDISRSFMSSRSGLGGTMQACTNPACQAAYSLEKDGLAGANTVGVRATLNTSLDTPRGVWNGESNGTSVTGLEFAGNRTINATVGNRFVTGGTINIDRGPTVGGNHWSNFFPTGNPSSQPFTGVEDSVSLTTGRVVDRFPYASETLGRGYNISIFEPRANGSVAQGSRRTVRWDSVGCTYVDLSLAGIPILTATPNTGYAIVTIPTGAPTGSVSFTASCRDSVGNIRSTTTGPTFAVSSSALKLVTPGRDDVFNTNQQIWVSWTNANTAVLPSVTIEYSPDGGASWPTTLATISNLDTNPVTSTRVTLPGTGTAYGKIRVRNGPTIDELDGHISVRGASGALVNVAPGRVFVMGQMERLEWSAPQGSRLVTINATVGAVTHNVATDLPDRGSFDWVVPDLGPGTLSLSLTFKTIAGATIGGVVTNAASGLTRYPTTISFNGVPSVAPGGSSSVNVTANSGVAVALTSDTPSICTVLGTTVTGQANGTCTLTANAPASGNFTIALPSTISFATGAAQTITFTAPGYLAVGGTITLSATASSGLAVVFSSLTPGVCSITLGNILTGNTLGTCTVAANQPGSGGVGAAVQVTRNINTVAAADIPRLVNISTRMQVLTGSDVMIAGVIIGGNAPKTVVIRARGPSLTALGVPGALANPVLQLFSGQTQIAVNDNWQQAANQATLLASGFAPSDPLESAIFITLSPGAYTGIVTGANSTTGVGLVEVFEVDLPNLPLLNIATRGNVQTGSNVMIAGFIIQGSAPQTVVVRARGPSLTAQGVPGVLANPKLQLFSGQTEIASNDDWQTAGNAATLQSAGFAPADNLESAILITLAPGAYTAIVTGVGNTTGVAIVEVFAQ